MAGQINKKELLNIVYNSNAVKNVAMQIVKENFEKEKQQLIQEFSTHPITQELEAGENSDNSSGTLGGYGNLFSFIGFRIGDYPTEKVKELLRKISVQKRVGRQNNGFVFRINVPSKDELISATKMPWESGRSWLFGIEQGISGLGAYLYGKFEESRSGTGIQTRKNYSGRIYRPTKYFTSIYNRFQNKLKINK
ncbi:MAG: hypothetical protein RL736_60 [Pseudomonadota bacterium]|jgi:hypothetical protein